VPRAVTVQSLQLVMQWYVDRHGMAICNAVSSLRRIRTSSRQPAVSACNVLSLCGACSQEDAGGRGEGGGVGTAAGRAH